MDLVLRYLTCVYAGLLYPVIVFGGSDNINIVQ